MTLLDVTRTCDDELQVTACKPKQTDIVMAITNRSHTIAIIGTGSSNKPQGRLIERYIVCADVNEMSTC